MTRASVVAAPAAAAPVSSAVLSRKCDCGNHTSGEMCAECAEEKRKRARVSRFADRYAPALSPADGGGSSQVPPIVHSVLRESGQRMPPHLRAYMEPRFGADFSDVRLHTDGTAALSSRAVGASAYTVGSHIVFGANGYQPESPGGRRLLAHELTHVLQQRASGGGEQPPTSISDPADTSEHEAEATAQRIVHAPAPKMSPVVIGVAHGGGVAGAMTPVAAGSVQRDLSARDIGFIGLGVFGAAFAGFIAWAAGLFDRETFTEDELIEYFNLITRTREPEGRTVSDNKARDAVRKWAAGSARINLDAGHRGPAGTITGIDLKRLLIREMLQGPTTGSDEEAILTILDRSTADDILVLLDPSRGLSVQDLNSDIDGDNHDRFEAILEAKFPSGSAVRAQQTRVSGCTARQSLMLTYARDTAKRWVQNAITSLIRVEDTAVQQALDCRFRGATLKHRKKIIDRFEKVLALLPRRVYKCHPESGPGALEPILLRGSDNQLHESPCLQEDAASLVSRSGTFQPEVGLCPNFYGRDAGTQAVTIIHESVHASGLIDDPQYQPGCGLALATALQNPDSFAYLARDLATLTGNVTNPTAAATLPSVWVGNFKNRGPVSDENRSRLAGEVPGLGLDVNTGLNIMELRGDISGHRDGVQYEFRRTKEVAVWRKVAGTWERVRYVPPGADDDMLNRDEDLTPRNNRIFSMDGAGLADLSAPLGPQSAGADEAVYKGSFIESVEARVPPAGWTRVSNEFKWHTITWLERGPGQWTRKTGRNELEAGPITVGNDPPEPAAPAVDAGNTVDEPDAAQPPPTGVPQP
jgi:hypothetical protein